MNQGKYLKSTIYGGLDGIITTFAVVTGVTGASLSPKVILILGAANLFADGIAMAFGDFLSTKAENEYHASERSREANHIQQSPDIAKEKLADIYEAKGIDRVDAKLLVEVISQYPDAMLDAKMVDELGILADSQSALGNSAATFFSFVIFGSFPLAVYLFGELIGESSFFSEYSLLIACVVTGVTLFSLGALKGKVTTQNRIVSGFEMLLIGGLAASVAYGIGSLLEGLF